MFHRWGIYRPFNTTSYRSKRNKTPLGRSNEPKMAVSIPSAIIRQYGYFIVVHNFRSTSKQASTRNTYTFLDISACSNRDRVATCLKILLCIHFCTAKSEYERPVSPISGMRRTSRVCIRLRGIMHRPHYGFRFNERVLRSGWAWGKSITLRYSWD